MRFQYTFRTHAYILNGLIGIWNPFAKNSLCSYLKQ